MSISYVDETGFPLGRWLSVCRGHHRRHELPDDRVVALTELGFRWKDDPEERWWQTRIEAARVYRNMHGDLNVPLGHQGDDGFHLGRWIEAMQAQHATGALSAERASELEALGVKWREPPEDPRWTEGFTAAVKYRADHRDLRVPATYVTGDGLRLGRWIAKRRTERRQGRLRTHRISMLDSIGMVWEPRA